jgi:hypothetical protein
MPHIPSERLATVAKVEDLLFTDDEFRHIQMCADCFKKWKALFADTHDIGKAIDE